MKKLLAALLAVFCLTACSAKQEEVPAAQAPVEEPEAVVEKIPEVEEVPVEEVVVEEEPAEELTEDPSALQFFCTQGLLPLSC